MKKETTPNNWARNGMYLSLLIAGFLLVAKLIGYWITDSAAILSDAAESVVHLFAVVFAAYSLRVSEKPPDDYHLYGHTKISFFSSAFEGVMIILAALYIMWEASHNLISGSAPTRIDFGLWLSAAVLVINLILGFYLLYISKHTGNFILKSNGQHVLTDAWTSAGVFVGLILTHATGWAAWDPIVAIIIALNIMVTGAILLRKSVDGLMDHADPKIADHLANILDQQTSKHHIQFHKLRFRDIGGTLDVDVDLLFPDEMSIKEAHEIATKIERVLQKEIFGKAIITTHLEPIQHHVEVHPQSPYRLPPLRNT
jgi:cation diffusion facilitator family transporter